MEGTTTLPRPQVFQAVLGSWFQPPWPLAFNAGPIAETRVTADWEFMREGVPPGCYTPNVLEKLLAATWLVPEVGDDRRPRPPQVSDGGRWPGHLRHRDHVYGSPGAVSGLVADAAGRTDAAAGVLAFPLDYQSWLENGSPPAVARAIPAAHTGADHHSRPAARRLPGGRGRARDARLIAARDSDGARRTGHTRHSGERRCGPRGPAPPMRRGSLPPRNRPRRRRARGARCCPADHGDEAVPVFSRRVCRHRIRSPASSSATIPLRVPSRALRSRCYSAALPRPLQLLTDYCGCFAFTGLSSASFTIAAAKPTYLALSYGQTTPGRGSGLPIALEAGQQLPDLRLVLPRGAVISGRVVDDRSRPVANAPIQVLQYRTVNGERALTNVSGSWPQTDAHGGYRAYGLPPGDYLVCAHPPGDFAAIPQDCRPGGGGEGAREVAAAECSGLASRFRPRDAAAPSPARRRRPRPHRANRSPSVPCSTRRRRVRPAPPPSRSAAARNARASTSR